MPNLVNLKIQSAKDKTKMNIDFRIDWGYHYLYSRKHYHPIYIWDGEIICSNGKIKEVFKLEYPYCWYGIPHSAKETKLSGNEWKNTP